MKFNLEYAINHYLGTIEQFDKLISNFEAYLKSQGAGRLVESQKTCRVFEILGERVEFKMTPYPDVESVIGAVVCNRFYKAPDDTIKSCQFFNLYLDKLGEFGIDLNTKDSFDLLGNIDNNTSVETFVSKAVLRKLLEEFDIEIRNN